MKKLSVQTKAERSIDYTHVQNGMKGICFMFSGLGYTYDKPLFHYASMLMKQKQIDFVHIEYSYSPELFESDFETILEEMMNDVSPVVDDILREGHYQETIFLGKSIGTIPLIGGLLEDERFHNAKWIALTPLVKLEPLKESLLATKNRSLLVIGDQDPHYDEKIVQQLQGSHQVNVVSHADHSLEVEDTATSLQILSDTVQTIADWVNT
ncbi:alpha/beta hydrolase [Geomicrobium sp. JSM 1781026]|uniref:alpha/beta hydrolase n=1 Tax=Geomicrobium sp. JSM 1781026 TaxID=3344580 RepID=UPI0035C18C53